MKLKIEWHNKKSLCIVLCSKGYPDKYNNNVLIKNLNKIKFFENEYCYHAGTKKMIRYMQQEGGF